MNVLGRAVFMDRDGTLIDDVGYPSRADDVRLLPGAAEALSRFGAGGYKRIVISNQSGIGRGLITQAQAKAVHERLLAVLAEAGAEIDAAYYCPHAPDESCSCRKPSPELILQAARELDLDPSGSFMIGDKPSDVEAGVRAGCRTILLSSRPTEARSGVEADAVVAGWPDAVEHVLTADRAISG